MRGGRAPRTIAKELTVKAMTEQPATIEAPTSESTSSEGANARGSGRKRFGRWGKRLGVAGFCFFFFKGLLWLIIPAWIVIERGCANP
jgi:hypothetical protein